MNHDIAIALSSSSRANTDFVLIGGIYMFISKLMDWLGVFKYYCPGWGYCQALVPKKFSK